MILSVVDGVFSVPFGIEGDGEGCGTRGWGAFSREESASEASNLVLLEGNVEFTLLDHVGTVICGGDLQFDGAGEIMEEGVEVEFLLALWGGEGHLLGGLDRTESCCGIEGTRPTCIFEFQFGNIGRNIVVDDETAECDDSFERQGEGEGLIINGDDVTVEKCVSIACSCVAKLYLCRIS